MSSNPTQFIIIKNQVVYSNCVVYQNDQGIIIHLIPVLHIGELEYYDELVSYVGNKRCLYEYLDVDYEKLFDKLPENFSINMDYGDLLEIFKTMNFYQINGKNFKRMIKANDRIHELLKFVKEGSNSSKDSQLVYKICESVCFGLDALSVLQRYMSELLAMKSQTIVLDYKGDIFNQPNWEHVDLEMELDLEVLKKPLEITPPLVEEWSKQMGIVLETLYVCIMIEKIDDVKTRRKEFTENILSIFTQKSGVDEMVELLPEWMMGVRNMILEEFILSPKSDEKEFSIFYGAGHMYALESILISNGFKVKKETPIKVFGF